MIVHVYPVDGVKVDWNLFDNSNHVYTTEMIQSIDVDKEYLGRIVCSLALDFDVLLFTTTKHGEPQYWLQIDRQGYKFSPIESRR